MADDKIKAPDSVLFVCNHNSIRSPMAAAMTRSIFGKKIYVSSAGLRIGKTDEFVNTVLKEIGIDNHKHEPRALDDLDEGYFDLIVTLSPTAHHIALERAHVDASEIEYWPAADPTVVQGSRQQQLDAYRDVRDRLKVRIEKQFGTEKRQINQ